LFDQNISFRIISKIEANFHSKQRQLGIENYSILKYGSMLKKTKFTIVNFDADF
jgi:hypothetical protein